MTAKTKSPLKDKPLRYVAQSADEAIDDLLNERVLLYWIALCMMGVGIFYEWRRYLHPVDTPPYLVTILFGIACIFCGYKIYRHIHKFKALKLGRSGERAVGQYLETFREMGCHVYHDILGDKFNVDHVVISPKGIFVIETKTYSKPAKGDARIHFDGQKILINGNEPLTDIVTQVSAGSSYIKRILKKSTGKDFDAFPVVLFPGWFVEGEGNKKGKMWVLEPKAFKKFIDRQQLKLSEEDVQLASYHLSRSIRTY